MTALPTAEVLAILSQYDTPTVCNVIELCDHQPRNTGYLRHSIRAIYPEMPPMVGYAVTVAFRSATVAAPEETPLSLFDLLEAWQSIPPPRVAVIQDLDHLSDGAVCGEIMVSVFKGFSCVGLVTNGCVRDIHQIKSLHFPCFAAGISPSHAYCRLLLANQPVSVGGRIIRPGDLLHGDGNGVTTIPAPIATKVADHCAEYVAAEQILIEGAKGGLTLSLDKFRESIQAFTKRHDELSKKMSGHATDRRVGV